MYYLGVPYHDQVLLSQTAVGTLDTLCNPGAFICRGVYAFVPFLQNSFLRAAPFLGYAIISAILFAVVVGLHAVRTGALAFGLRLRPWHILLIFTGSVWLFLTTFAAVSSDGVSPRRLIEPTAAIYKGTSEEGLQVLIENFNTLKDNGCLTYTGKLPNGANAYEMKSLCVQKSFFARVFPPLFVIFLILVELLIAGRMVLSWLKLKPDGVLLEAVISSGLGTCFFVAVLWTIAVISKHIGLPLYNMWVGWGLMIAIPIIGWQHLRYWLHSFIESDCEINRQWYDPTILLMWLLVSLLAYNFLTVVRPFPIGWDDLGSYLNRPRLLVSYGEFIFSMATFMWEYISSLGYLLFGFQRYFSATIAMEINWMAGLLATASVFVFTRALFGKGRGVLAALLYYSMPVVGHFSFADMKIDNAVFTLSALSALCVFLYLFKTEEQQWEKWKGLAWVVAAGVLGGFAFAFKPTAIMALVPLGVAIIGVLLHWSAFIGVLFLVLGLFMWKGLDFAKTIERIFGEGSSLSPGLVLAVCLIVGFVALGIVAWKYRSRVQRTVLATGLFSISFLASVSPWLVHNNILQYMQNGTMPSLVELKAPNDISPFLYIDEASLKEQQSVKAMKRAKVARFLPQELVVDRSNPACIATAGTEELDRYWGFNTGFKHYLTLPWRSVMSLDSVGYYVTLSPALLLFPLLLLLPFFWMRGNRQVRWLFLCTVLMLAEWVFMANGVPWYGLGTMLGLVVLLEVLMAKVPDVPNRAIAGILFSISLIIVFGMRLWQFDGQRNLLEYPMGKSSAAVMIERTVPYYNDIAEIALARKQEYPDRPYMYRIGTFITYFIPRNLEVIGNADHQLDFFSCIYQEGDAALTTQRLKALGFNSIIFDTNTATIEKNSEGSLHQKVNRFVEYVNDPESGLQVLISDTNAGVAFALIP